MDNCSLEKVLNEIIERDVYKNDYETITTNLLFEVVPYQDAINNLKDIVKKCFTTSNKKMRSIK